MNTRTNSLRMVEALPTMCLYWVNLSFNEGYSIRDISLAVQRGLKLKIDEWENRGREEIADEMKKYLRLLREQGLDKYLQII